MSFSLSVFIYIYTTIYTNIYNDEVICFNQKLNVYCFVASKKFKPSGPWHKQLFFRMSLMKAFLNESFFN